MKEDDPTRDANWNNVREFWQMFFEATPHIIFTLLDTELTRKKAKTIHTHPMNQRQRRYVEMTERPKIEARTALVRERQKELLRSFGMFAKVGFLMTRSAARNSLSQRSKRT